jgi:hypothetical protein
MTRFRHRLQGLALLAMLGATPVQAQNAAFDVGDLMQTMAKTEASEAAFTETKHLALLAEPLVSSGTLRFRRPDYLERETLTPTRERFIYEGGKISIEANGRQRQLQVDAQPALAGLIESMRATLAGDEDALRRHYNLHLSGTLAHWNLEMLPKQDALAKRVRKIRVSGEHDRLRQIEISEASGDSTLMNIDAPPH